MNSKVCESTANCFHYIMNQSFIKQEIIWSNYHRWTIRIVLFWNSIPTDRIVLVLVIFSKDTNTIEILKNNVETVLEFEIIIWCLLWTFRGLTQVLDKREKISLGHLAVLQVPKDGWDEMMVGYISTRRSLFN